MNKVCSSIKKQFTQLEPTEGNEICEEFYLFQKEEIQS